MIDDDDADDDDGDQNHWKQWLGRAVLNGSDLSHTKRCCHGVIVVVVVIEQF